MTGRNRKWTAEEDKVLRELVGIQPYQTIGDLIGRSASSVHGRAKTLKITPGHRRGERHHAARLTSLQASMIGVLLDAGYSAREVTEAMGLSVGITTVGDIGRGTTWGRS